MTQSILTSTKQILLIDPAITEFDEVIKLHINSAFADLHQIGITPGNKPFEVTDKDDTWDEFINDMSEINMVKTWMGNKVRLLFDPPTTSFGIEALSKVVAEQEYRMNLLENLFVN